MLLMAQAALSLSLTHSSRVCGCRCCWQYNLSVSVLLHRQGRQISHCVTNQRIVLQKLFGWKVWKTIHPVCPRKKLTTRIFTRCVVAYTSRASKDDTSYIYIDRHPSMYTVSWHYLPAPYWHTHSYCNKPQKDRSPALWTLCSHTNMKFCVLYLPPPQSTDTVNTHTQTNPIFSTGFSSKSITKNITCGFFPQTHKSASLFEL